MSLGPAQRIHAAHTQWPWWFLRIWIVFAKVPPTYHPPSVESTDHREHLVSPENKKKVNSKPILLMYTEFRIFLLT